MRTERFSPEQIDTVKRSIDIALIVGRYVLLKPQGPNRHVGLCPFHSEKTPSFTVNTDLQIYKCFGCDACGDVFTFLQEIENTSFPRVLRACADLTGVTLSQQQPANGVPVIPLSEQAIAEAGLWRLAWTWKIERALEIFKEALFTESHDRAAEAVRSLTEHQREVQKWTSRECALKARLVDPELVRACIDEAREFQTTLALIIAAAGENQQCERAA